MLHMAGWAAGVGRGACAGVVWVGAVCRGRVGRGRVQGGGGGRAGGAPDRKVTPGMAGGRQRSRVCTVILAMVAGSDLSGHLVGVRVVGLVSGRLRTSARSRLGLRITRPALWRLR